MKTDPLLAAVSDSLLGVPYLENGRSANGANCVWTVMEFHRLAWGIEIPDPLSDDPKTVLESDFAAGFVLVEPGHERDGDVALFENKELADQAMHLGIRIGDGILNVHHRYATARLPLRICRVKQYYRHRSRAE